MTHTDDYRLGFLEGVMVGAQIARNTNAQQAQERLREVTSPEVPISGLTLPADGLAGSNGCSDMAQQQQPLSTEEDE